MSPNLTPRQLQVLQGLADGRSYKEIAALLCVSPQVIRHHCARARRSLHAPTNAAAVANAVALGLVVPVLEWFGVAPTTKQ